MVDEVAIFDLMEVHSERYLFWYIQFIWFIKSIFAVNNYYLL
jgi:hypothetical protein